MNTKNKGAEVEMDARENPEDVYEKKQYRKHLEEDVSDAQYMMIYTTTYCEDDLDKKTIEKLINARILVESGQGLDADKEADFRVAYQKLWEKVKPATAESIKANLPTEKTFFGWLLGGIPFLSKWTENWTISKSRKSVNLYIVFTAVILALLLVFQIYWVIGNQLTTQLNDLLDKRAGLNLSINANQIEYDKLEVRYMEEEAASEGFTGTYTFYSGPAWKRDILENRTANTRIKTDLDVLNGQIDRNLNILTVWSSPWTWLIETDAENEVEHLPEYQSEFESLDNLIAQKEGQISADPKGEIAAFNQNDPIQKKLDLIESQSTDFNNQIQDIESQQPSKKERLEEISNFLIKRAALLQLGEQWYSTPSDSEAERIAEENINNFEDVQILASVDKDALYISLKCLYSVSVEGDPANCDQSSGVVSPSFGDIELEMNYGVISMDTAVDVFSKLNSEKNNLENELANLGVKLVDVREKLNSLDAERLTLSAKLTTAAEVKAKWNNELKDLKGNRDKLVRQERIDKKREASLAAQLAGQLFVLNILQSYILPILYGLLGAGTSVLRSLSRKIKEVTYSRVAEIQHILNISLGALTGIVVGWFSFLLPQESTGFLGSVSPLAIAFLVGYNIDLFFTRMDFALNKAKDDTSKDQSKPE